MITNGYSPRNAELTRPHRSLYSPLIAIGCWMTRGIIQPSATDHQTDG